MRHPFWNIQNERVITRLGTVAACLLTLVLALAIGMLPLPWAAALLLVPLALTLALLDPILALGLAVLSVPVQELVQLPGGITVTQACLLLAAASLALHTLAFPEQPLRFGRLFGPLALFIWTLCVAAALTPYNFAAALTETSRWATVPLIYLLTLRALEGNRQQAIGDSSAKGVQVQPSSGVPTIATAIASCPASAASNPPPSSWRLWLVLACLLAAPLAEALLGLAQFALGVGPASFGIGGGRVRAYGTIGQPNSFAGYMNQGWPLAAGVALFALLGVLQGAGRLALVVLLGAGGAAALMLAALLASFSRGGWVGALGGALALLLVALPRLPRQLRATLTRVGAAGLAAGLLLLLLAGGLLPDALQRRASSLVTNLRLFDARGVEVNPANFAVVERMAHLQAGWNMLVRYPLTGVGPGNYSVAYQSYPAAGERPINVRPWYDSRGHAHNYYLHIAAESGLLGLGAYLVLVGATALQAIRALRAARDWLWQGLAAGGAGVIAAVAAHNLFENLHVLNMGLQLGTIWALLVVAERAGANTDLVPLR